ncbi:efflux RND transporter periplasmic adaptor subunit [Methylopila sp. 73B]|uniref:efflux RND transporter periplasmic adaptor subunit n=1 Tax=Methylopila sp. 73B TaxID=1120792 RepID=UPI00056D78A3|nr:efflux RND transporter periplasmic adaptor subunit [Methylopila sp. 73B]
MSRTWAKSMVVGVLLISAAYVGLVHFDRPSKANARQGPDAAPAAQTVRAPIELTDLEVIRLEPTSMKERIRVSGELRPINRVALRSKAAGTVSEVNARPGQRVAAGDVLIRFETEDLQAALVQHISNRDGAAAELLRAEQTFARVEQLAQKSYASREQLDRARGDLGTARAKAEALSAQIDMAQTALRNAEIRAPFGGVVSDRLVDPGAAPAANAELMTVVDTSVLEAQMLVATRDVPRLMVGDSAELEIDGLNGRMVAGTVDRISPVANEGSRFVPVFVRLENREGRLWGGMFATGSVLVREEANVIVVPATSLREDEQGRYVLKLEGDRLVRQAVAVRGRWNEGESLQIDGARIGDLIVASPLPQFRPGVAALLGRPS